MTNSSSRPRALKGHPITFEVRSGDGQHRGLAGASTPAAREQRTLSHAVARVGSRGAKPRRRERFAETLHRIRRNRCCPSERDLPAREIELSALLRGHSFDAVIIGETRSTTRGSAVLRDRGQPTKGTLKEAGRSHQHGANAEIEWLEDVTDQSHVVEEWKPSNEASVRIVAHGLLHHFCIVQQILVRDHRAPRRPSCPRGILDESYRARIRPEVRCVAGSRVGLRVTNERVGA